MENPRRTALFVGAGFSKEAGLPTAIELTHDVVEDLRNGGDCPVEILRALTTVIGGLQLRLAHDELAPFRGVDIEAVISSLRALGERNTLPTSPFVATWHDLIKDLGGPEVFRSVLESVLTSIERRLWLNEEDSDRLEFLNPLNAALYPGTSPISVFSLNYDNVFELWAAKNRRYVQTGFDRVFDGELKFSDMDCIHLFKLHGSIDWLESDMVCTKETPFSWTTVSRRDFDNPQDSRIKTAILVGDGNKLSPDGPFLDLFTEFGRRLKQIDRLIVSGYSFRDHHINACLGKWLNARPGSTISVYNKPQDVIEMSFELFNTEFEAAAVHGRVISVDGGGREAIQAFTRALTAGDATNEPR